MHVMHTTADVRRLAGPIALVLALGISVTTCRLDKLINPATADRLTVSPSTIDTLAHVGSAGAKTVTLHVATADGATLSWTASESAVWLDLSSSNGATPDSVVVTMDPDTLSQTLHQDTIKFVATGSTDTIRVPVSLDMLPPAPELSVTPTSRAETAFVGSAAPNTFTLSVKNSGALPLTWTATLDTGWIALSDSSTILAGQDSTLVLVTLDPDSLPAGTHRGSINIAAPGAIGAPAAVPVTYTVRPCNETGITLDTVVTGAIGLSDCGAPQRAGRQAKVYSVQAAAGDTLSFRLTAAFNAYLVLTNKTGVAVLDENDQCVTPSTACLLNFIVSTTDRYLIEVTTTNPGETGAFTLSAVKELSPSQPASNGQFRADGTTAIAVGAVTPESTVVFKATLNDPNPGDSVRLEVEVEGLATSPQTHVTPFVPRGTPVALPVTPLNDNEGYHWRARTCDQTGRCSTWFNFGGNVDPAADFIVNWNPENPVMGALAQIGPSGPMAIGGGTGGSYPNSVVVTFNAGVTDFDPGDLISIEVEYKKTNAAFDSTTTRGTGVASGGTATVSVSIAVALLNLQADYHWRARVCDQTNRCSAWVGFGGNSDVVTADIDFHVP
jgi:hypothetical protein